MDLPYDALRTFRSVARHLSFSRAGQELLRSQSAVSLQVAKLEGVVGQRLLERSTKRVALTEAGEILVRFVDQTEALLAQAGQELEDLDTLVRGRLVLCASDTTACYRLPEVMRDFRSAYPGIEIVVRNATSPRTLDAVREGEVDLGIATLGDLPDGLASRRLFARRDVLICPPGHRLARRRRLLLKDLETQPFILLDDRCASRRLLDDACRRARATLPVAMELSSIEVIKRFVRIDAGLSIVPESAVREEVEAGQLCSVEIEDFERRPPRYMGVVFRKGRYLGRAAERFLDALDAHFGPPPARRRGRPAKPRGAQSG